MAAPLAPKSWEKQYAEMRKALRLVIGSTQQQIPIDDAMAWTRLLSGREMLMWILGADEDEEGAELMVLALAKLVE